jgi:hypothetical protein
MEWRIVIVPVPTRISLTTSRRNSLPFYDIQRIGRGSQFGAEPGQGVSVRIKYEDQVFRLGLPTPSPKIVALTQQPCFAQARHALP